MTQEELNYVVRLYDQQINHEHITLTTEEFREKLENYRRVELLNYDSACALADRYAGQHPETHEATCAYFEGMREAYAILTGEELKMPQLIDLSEL